MDGESVLTGVGGGHSCLRSNSSLITHTGYLTTAY